VVDDIAQMHQSGSSKQNVDIGGAQQPSRQESLQHPLHSGAVAQLPTQPVAPPKVAPAHSVSHSAPVIHGP